MNVSVRRKEKAIGRSIPELPPVPDEQQKVSSRRRIKLGSGLAAGALAFLRGFLNLWLAVLPVAVWLVLIEPFLAVLSTPDAALTDAAGGVCGPILGDLFSG